MAAQLSVTKGWVRRALQWCSARARSSLPVPVSPWMSTVVSVGATSSSCVSTDVSAALCPMIPSKRCVAWRTSRTPLIWDG
jgi:hypothetical protein